MSVNSLKLKVWRKADKVRVYIDTRFCDYRLGMGRAHNGYFFATENDKLSWRSAEYPTMSSAPHFAIQTVLSFLEGNTIEHYYRNAPAEITFSQLIERIEACQTKGGNFSFSQYYKKYLINKEVVH
jgi:hypothetical protein